ncbi:tetratricopeptide repeat protein [Orbus mooreae]|uniref:tetratricopeptide repeat protein n=1 Tax=Orbus mooreae TaxID=3074107 RepID=UPI00370D51E0
MPVLGIGLSTIIAIICAIHVIRTGQSLYWLFILFVFPFFGSLVYFIAIILPNLRSSHSGYLIESQLRKAFNPAKELREAQQVLEISPTIDAKVRLAKALVDNGRVKEAIPYYEQALSNIYKTAPDILLQYALALYQDKQYDKAIEQLDLLRKTNPNYSSAEGHLLYANILVALDKQQQAQQEFNALLGYTPTFEALSCYLAALIRWGNTEEARKQLLEFETRLKHMPKHAKRLNAQWIKEIKQIEAQLGKSS